MPLKRLEQRPRALLQKHSLLEVREERPSVEGSPAVVLVSPFSMLVSCLERRAEVIMVHHEYGEAQKDKHAKNQHQRGQR